jgi:hypothetical protein
VTFADLRTRFAGALLVLFAIAAHAQADPALFGDLGWRLVGPFRGGRVLAVVGRSTSISAR